MADTGELRREVALRDGRTFQWRAATPDDAELVWGWWTDPAMVYWNREQRLDPVGEAPYDATDVRAYLEQLLGTPIEERPLDPLVGMLEGQPAAYAELWTKRNSPLAASEELADIEGDARGMHLIVADRRARLRGVTVEIAVDAIEWQFDEWPTALHGIADPDVRNQGIISLCARLGMKRVALVPMRHKTACVMTLDRDAWQQERPAINDLLDRVLTRRPRVKTR